MLITSMVLFIYLIEGVNVLCLAVKNCQCIHMKYNFF